MATVYSSHELWDWQKEKGCRWNLEETRVKLPKVLFQWHHSECSPRPQQWFVATYVKCPSSEDLIRHSVLRFYGEQSHRHSLLSYTKILDSQKERRCLIETSVCTIHHSYQGTVGTFSKPKFPGNSPGPILWAGRCKDGNLRCAMLTLLHKRRQR